MSKSLLALALPAAGLGVGDEVEGWRLSKGEGLRGVGSGVRGEG
jgi:hypothetical protein